MSTLHMIFEKLLCWGTTTVWMSLGLAALTFVGIGLCHLIHVMYSFVDDDKNIQYRVLDYHRESLADLRKRVSDLEVLVDRAGNNMDWHDGRLVALEKSILRVQDQPRTKKGKKS